MFRCCAIKPSGRSGEKRVIERLAAAYDQLILPNGIVDIYAVGCSSFLKQIEVCALHLGVVAEPRLYRNSFTVNYRLLFNDAYGMHYRADLVQACFERCPDMWVNGKLHRFSQQTILQADALKECVEQLGGILRRWTVASKQPSRADVKSLLEEFDSAWAVFECDYIGDLIEIEAVARSPLVKAIQHEQRLATLEVKHGQAPLQVESYVEEQHQLFACLAELNTFANVGRLGRDDMTSEALIAAQRVLLHGGALGTGSVGAVSGSQFIRSLAQDLVDSFQAMRGYLRKVAESIERVDPQLQKNAGLAARLEDLEESWEMSSRYIQDKGMRDALDNAIDAIESAQALVPCFKGMFEDCGAEFFMVLPRVVLLGFLKAPGNEMLLKAFLPHCFGHKDATANSASTSNHFQHLLDQFSSTRCCLSDAQPRPDLPARESIEDVAWEILMRRAVLGTSSDATHALYDRLEPALRKESERTVEAFMRELEAWSIELQRHRPRDWNGLSAVLVQGLSSGFKKDRETVFQV